MLSPRERSRVHISSRPDNIIHALAGLKEVFVISRGSTLGYGGAKIDVRAIGRELGVRYVMYGSVQRAAGHLRSASRRSQPGRL